MGKTIGMFVVALVIIATGLWYLINQPIMGWPDESRREGHLAGFSIIRPNGWTAFHTSKNDPGSAGDMIQFLPVKAEVGSPVFGVTKLITKPTAENYAEKKYVPTTFQGQPAFKFEGKVKRAFIYSIAFERAGSHYEISLGLPEQTQIEGHAWYKYFESFQVSDSQSK